MAISPAATPQKGGHEIARAAARRSTDWLSVSELRGGRNFHDSNTLAMCCITLSKAADSVMAKTKNTAVVTRKANQLDRSGQVVITPAMMTEFTKHVVTCASDDQLLEVAIAAQTLASVIAIMTRIRVMATRIGEHFQKATVARGGVRGQEKCKVQFSP